MIIDTSALVVILRGEPERMSFADAIAQDPFPRMSAANYLEVGVVVDGRRNPTLSRLVDSVIAEGDIAIEPVTARQALIARAAYRDSGRDSGHAARLNFGDCCAYALAKDTGEELLVKGDDFIPTDIRPAL